MPHRTRFDHLKADVLAGLVVGVLALPLAMALAIASGVAPQHGLYTSIFAGAACAAFGGSRFNVSGPTAAFVALLVPISARFGLEGLLVATFMAGAILLLMGLAQLGRLVQFIPYPVTTGFTAGIAVVIATLQMKDFLGLDVVTSQEHFWEKVAALARAVPNANGPDLAVGVFALAGLVVLPRFVHKLPPALLVLPAAAVLAWAIERWMPGARVATIGSRFSWTDELGAVHGGIPDVLPSFSLPWRLPDADGRVSPFTFEHFRELVGPSLTIALLGAIESLLCAVVADGMAGTKHDPNRELIGQGIGNLLAPCFGGIAATGAIARTATNVRAGARTRSAAVVHAFVVLLAMLALGRWLAYLPMSALAALLLIAAWNMSDARHFLYMVRIAPRSDLAVLLTCFGLTVVFDMVLAVGVGIVLAALLFMRRMAEISSTRLLPPIESQSHDLPQGVLFYEIAGPLFFGAAEKAVSALQRIHDDCKAVILHLGDVPAMDVSGLVALRSAIRQLRSSGARVIVAGLEPQPRGIIERAELATLDGGVRVFVDLEEAIETVREDAGLPRKPVDPEQRMGADTAALI